MLHIPVMNMRMAALLVLGLLGCGGDDPSTSQNSGSGSNRARFTFDCDLNGATAVLTMEVEAINTAGIVFGPGANPDITAVIGTGQVLYVTAGELRSNVALYTFTGENNFADFVDMATFDRFLVQWVGADDGLTMVINPFGPGPAQHSCVSTGAVFL